MTAGMKAEFIATPEEAGEWLARRNKRRRHRSVESFAWSEAGKSLEKWKISRCR